VVGDGSLDGSNAPRILRVDESCSIGVLLIVVGVWTVMLPLTRELIHIKSKKKKERKGASPRSTEKRMKRKTIALPLKNNQTTVFYQVYPESHKRKKEKGKEKKTIYTHLAIQTCNLSKHPCPQSITSSAC
jgi:preprotein translocase subunit Sec63